MAESIETSDKANKSFYSNVFVLLFIVKLHIKKFKQFCLSDLLLNIKYLIKFSLLANYPSGCYEISSRIKSS